MAAGGGIRFDSYGGSGIHNYFGGFLADVVPKTETVGTFVASIFFLVFTVFDFSD